MAKGNSKPPSGIGVDASGGPVIDPSQNVLDLVDAANLRQDDLRIAENRYQNDLRSAESQHWREIWDLQRAHLRELREAEKERIDAIRHVDVEATAVATRATEERAGTLAKQTETMAETLRQQVAQTGRESNNELKAALQPLMGAIEELRRWQYESAGQKQQVVETRDESGSKAVWIGLIGVALFNVAGLIIAVMALKP